MKIEIVHVSLWAVWGGVEAVMNCGCHRAVLCIDRYG